jgi:hypothetical protein
VGGDWRYPTGLLFSLCGAILVAYELLHPTVRAVLAPVRLNLYAGLVMLAFGASLLLLAVRDGRPRG